MKNYKHIQILITTAGILTLLTGCKPEYRGKTLIAQIIEPTNDAALYQSIDKERIETFKEGKKSFILFFGSDRCEPCRIVKKPLEKFLKKSHIEIYYLNLYNSDYFDNQEYYALTIGLTGTPTFVLFENGVETLRELGSHNLSTYKAVETFFTRNIKIANYYIVNSDENYHYPEKYVRFSYNFDNPSQQAIINTYFYPNFEKENYNTYLVNNSEEFFISFGNLEEKHIITDDTNQITGLLEDIDNYFGNM